MPPLQANGRSMPARNAASRMASPSATGTSRRLPSMISDAIAFGGAPAAIDGFGTRLAAELRHKTLDVNAVRRNADPAAGRLDVLAHPGRTADENVIDRCRRNQRAQQHPHLVAVKPPVQDRNVLLLARDHMEHRQPLHEAVFQFLQRLAKQHATVERLP